jgi:crossover junction endodeoxyribonuclease RuvC
MQNSSVRKVLGIDCGTATTGWAVVNLEKGKLRHIASGAILTPKTKSPAQRLKLIHDELIAIITAYQPGSMAVESLFFARNQTTAMAVSQARGVILLCAAEKGIEAAAYTPLQVKAAVTGYGKAEKKQVQFMVKRILRLKETPKPDDVADAIAVAICHLNSSK